MKPKHIQIDHELLKSAAQAHPFRPIRTALESQNIDNIQGIVPDNLHELYRWMRTEDRLNTLPPQRIWTQLMTVPFIFIPISSIKFEKRE